MIRFRRAKPQTRPQKMVGVRVNAIRAAIQYPVMLTGMISSNTGGSATAATNTRTSARGHARPSSSITRGPLIGWRERRSTGEASTPIFVMSVLLSMTHTGKLGDQASDRVFSTLQQHRHLAGRQRRNHQSVPCLLRAELEL